MNTKTHNYLLLPLSSSNRLSKRLLLLVLIFSCTLHNSFSQSYSPSLVHAFKENHGVELDNNTIIERLQNRFPDPDLSIDDRVRMITKVYSLVDDYQKLVKDLLKNDQSKAYKYALIEQFIAHYKAENASGNISFADGSTRKQSLRTYLSNLVELDQRADKEIIIEFPNSKANLFRDGMRGSQFVAHRISSSKNIYEIDLSIFQISISYRTKEGETQKYDLKDWGDQKHVFALRILAEATRKVMSSTLTVNKDTETVSISLDGLESRKSVTIPNAKKLNPKIEANFAL